MKRKKLFTLVICCFCLTIISCASKTKKDVDSGMAVSPNYTDLTAQLMEVLGFESMFESARQDSIKMFDKQINMMVSQVRKSNPNIPDSAIKEIKEASDVFGQKVLNSWSPSEAAKLYSSVLVNGLSEKETLDAINNYNTSQGKNELKVINLASQELNTYIMRAMQKESESATKEFFNQIQLILRKAKK